MPFNFDPNSYTTDPAHFSAKAKEVMSQLANTSVNKIGSMNATPDIAMVLYFHRHVGLVMVTAMGGDGGPEHGYQGLNDPQTSINKMLVYLDNIGSTDPDAIPEMQLVRGQMFKAFEGTVEEYQNYAQGGAISRMFAVMTADELPRFNMDFFQKVLERVAADAKTSELDVKA